MLLWMRVSVRADVDRRSMCKNRIRFDTGEGRPMFEIANLELSESSDISMMQLNLLDHSPTEA